MEDVNVEVVVCRKRRKGVDDVDVGVSASYTALRDQLEVVDAIADATTDPIVLLSLKRQVEAIRQHVLALMIAKSRSSLNQTTL